MPLYADSLHLSVSEFPAPNTYSVRYIIDVHCGKWRVLNIQFVATRTYTVEAFCILLLALIFRGPLTLDTNFLFFSPKNRMGECLARSAHWNVSGG